MVEKTCLLDIIHIAENHKVKLIFGDKNSMESFTTIIILKNEIDQTRDNSTLLLRLIMPIFECACGKRKILTSVLQ